MVAPQIEYLLLDHSVQTRANLASDPECPASVIELLAYDSDKVLSALIGNPRCTLTAITTAAEFRFERVHWSSETVLNQISRHPLLDLGLLLRFAVNRPILIVDHPLCPEELLVEFTQSHNAYLRACAVRRSSLPTDALLQVIGDPDAGVSAAIRLSVAERGYDTVREALPLMNPRGRRRLIRTLQPGAVDRLAGESDERIRYAVASSTDDPELLRRLAADLHGRVRRAASDRVFSSLVC